MDGRTQVWSNDLCILTKEGKDLLLCQTIRDLSDQSQQEAPYRNEKTVEPKKTHASPLKIIGENDGQDSVPKETCHLCIKGRGEEEVVAASLSKFFD